VHRLQLAVARVKPLQRADSEELSAPAETEERDRRIQQAIDVKRMDVLGRAVRTGENEVSLQQCANVPGSRVISQDLALKHTENLRDPVPLENKIRQVTCRPSVCQAACAYSVIKPPEAGNSVAAQR
jgi:hypothetical protein